MKIKLLFFFQKFCYRLQQEFTLTTGRITLLSYFLTLTTIVSLFEINYFIVPYLKIDVAAAINLIVIDAVSLPYALLVAIIFPWLRLIILPGADSIIGHFAIMLGSCSVVISFAVLHFLLQLFFYHAKSKIVNLIITIIAAILTILVTSILMVFYNYSFLLDLYAYEDKSKEFLLTLFIFNLVKFSCVIIIFLPVRFRLKRSFHFFNIKNKFEG